MTVSSLSQHSNHTIRQALALGCLFSGQVAPVQYSILFCMWAGLARSLSEARQLLAGGLSANDGQDDELDASLMLSLMTASAEDGDGMRAF